ncbi:hypothetical protein Leryth_027523 [Lithospermum erythrorhizon]|nr:hypothetical protein Leryth_027523 [Lithospermum erythrorhizon]
MLLDKNGRVKIIDFGVSKIEDLLQNTQNTGTLGFMAPEVLAGSSYDHKCDVFSFGICLWEIFCCWPYHSEAMDNPNLYKKVRPDLPKNCPSALADLMKQCWDADPNKRPEMRSVVETLREFEASTLHQGARRPSRLSCFSS